MARKKASPSVSGVSASKDLVVTRTAHTHTAEHACAIMRTLYRLDDTSAANAAKFGWRMLACTPSIIVTTDATTNTCDWWRSQHVITHGHTTKLTQQRPPRLLLWEGRCQHWNRDHLHGLYYEHRTDAGTSGSGLRVRRALCTGSGVSVARAADTQHENWPTLLIANATTGCRSTKAAAT